MMLNQIWTYAFLWHFSYRFSNWLRAALGNFSNWLLRHARACSIKLLILAFQKIDFKGNSSYIYAR
jgi:hypothetical protein